MYSTLLLDITGNLATITLNRPEKRNAISTQLMTELQTALDEIERSHARVAIVTGAGKAFCAGMDLDLLAAIAKQSPAENQEDSRRIAKMFRRIWSFPRPLIAAVNGAAYAGGCGLATLCDFTLAVPEAKFGYTEVKIGFLPAIVSVFLTRQIGEKRCRDLLLTGRIIDATEAKEFGLVSEVVPAERLIERARELADQLIAASPSSPAASLVPSTFWSRRQPREWIMIWSGRFWKMRAFAARRISRKDSLLFWRSASRCGRAKSSN